VLLICPGEDAWLPAPPAKELVDLRVIATLVEPTVKHAKSATCLGPPLDGLAEPIALRGKLACAWKKLLAACRELPGVDHRFMPVFMLMTTVGSGWPARLSRWGRERIPAG
jgi:hypothetical protein